MGGGTAGEVPKKYSRKGKLNKKIHARQLILKNIHAMALNNFIQGIWWRKKDSCCSKIPLPPP